jgi:DNA (cytosine-5)-methyltransferase 1
MEKKLQLLDLFSGIGGFSLGLERSGGFETVAFCEIDPFCRRVLSKHWPEVPQYDDIRTLSAERLAADGIGVDAICGGFPCQDISVAGKGAGLAGERSGLWFEYARLIGELRPRFVIVENVAALLGRGIGDVLGGLAALGYDAEWHCIPASAVGAPHRRDRLWVVAYANDGCELAEPEICAGWNPIVTRSKIVAYASRDASDGLRETWEITKILQIGRHNSFGIQHQWAIEPAVGRVAHGVPSRVDRLRSLGNAVVPQIPEMIGRAIIESMNA